MLLTIKKNKLGDTKTVTRFAFFPVHMSGDLYVWFEFYRAKMEYRKYDTLPPGWFVVGRQYRLNNR